MKQKYIKALNGFKLIMVIVLALLPMAASANEELKTNANITGHVTDKATGEASQYRTWQCRCWVR